MELAWAENKLGAIIQNLKSPSNHSVYNGLKEIRDLAAVIGIDICSKLIREKKGLKALVSLIQKPNEKILDLTLSILGNCCLENESRNEVVSHGIVDPLISILRTISRDSIQGRTCRLIGNLAQCSSVAFEFLERNVIIELVAVVDVGGSSSPATQQMAVRALRILWDTNYQRPAMLEVNVVRKVALLLTTPQEKREHLELLKVVTKALVVFTNNCSESCARQVHADGSGYQSLLALITNDQLKDSILLCICNLCHIANSRPILGSAGAVKIVVKELSEQDCYKPVPTKLYVALVTALCMLCRESVNRAKIRRAGGLPVILGIIRDSFPADLQLRALQALIHFIYDEISLQELLREGMVTILVTKLGNVVKKYGTVHEEIVSCNNSKSNKRPHFATVSEAAEIDDNKSKSPAKCRKEMSTDKINLADPNGSWEGLKRFRVSSPSYQAVVQEQCITNRPKGKGTKPGSTSPNLLFDFSSPERCSPSRYWSPEGYLGGDWSPGSPSSMCYSVDSSPPPSYRTSSPTPSTSYTSPSRELWSGFSSPVHQSSPDPDFPEVYSPVCFDVSDEDDEVKECSPGDGDKSEDHSIGSVGKCESPNWDMDLESGSSCYNDVQSSIGEQGTLLVLLSRISHMETPVEEMAIEATLLTLLDYVSLVRNPLPRAGRVLGRIVRNQNYFLQLLKHQFVLNVHDRLCRPVHEKCFWCNRLSTLGHSLLEQISMLAESGFGEGELAYHLLKADQSARRMLTVTVPYIVKAQRLLRKLLLGCKGLAIFENILNNFQGEKTELMEHVPTSLALLALALNISSPHYNMVHEDECLHKNIPQIMQKEIAQIMDGDIVIFKLDDGDTVPASKSFLCRHSPVFDAMLQGSFKESGEQTVNLHAVSSGSLLYLMYLMKLGRTPHCLPDLSLAGAEELLVILDRFLVEGSDELTELILRQFLDSYSAFDMYAHAVEMGSLKHFSHIREKTMHFILASDMTTKQRQNIFRQLLESPCSHQVSMDILDLFRIRLTSKDFK